jgi:hypothetical protein
MTIVSSVRCKVCHRALNAPEAIMLGIGPVCAKKQGYRRPRKLRKARVQPLFNLKEQTLGVPLFEMEAL